MFAMTKASDARRERRLRQKMGAPKLRLGAPKKIFADDPDRGTIGVAEVLHLIGFNREEAYDLATAVHEGKLVDVADGRLSFRLPVLVESRARSLLAKSERESTDADSLRRSLLAARLLIANRASTQESAIRALDSLLTIAAIHGPGRLKDVVGGMWGQVGKKRRLRRRRVWTNRVSD
jgi:hypothetical protein